jgi:hypothetical protein
VTFVNHRTDTDIWFVSGVTDDGKTLVNPGVLRYSPERLRGPSADGIGSGDGLPGWVDLKWKELDRDRVTQTAAWDKLDQAARDAYFEHERAVPIKSARVPIRAVVPRHVIEELKNSPPSKNYPTLPLKSIRYFLIWTKEGAKLYWEGRSGCCEVLYQGGTTGE